MNNESGIMNHGIKIFILYSLFFILDIAPASATTLSNQNYFLETQQIIPGNAENQTKTEATPIQTTTESLPSPFVFSLSDMFVDFGKLSATNPVTRTTMLSIVPGSANEYSIQAFEDHELSTSENKIIPDTTCDNGSCTQDRATLWNSILSYGLGYRENGFSLQKGYKRFANASKNEPAQVIMNGDNQDTKRQTTVTYKVNISNTQPIGMYTNTVTYIAVPNF